MITEGDYAGHGAILFKQSLPFPLMRLTSEIRAHIFRYVLRAENGEVKVTLKQGGSKSAYAPDYAGKHRLSLLQIDSEVRKEALPIVFEQRFFFPGTQALSSFLLQIGGSRIYIQHLRCDTYNPQTARTVFHLLQDCKNLKKFSFKHVSSNEQPKTAVKNMFNDAQGFLLNHDKEDPIGGLSKLSFDPGAFHMRTKNDDGSYSVIQWGPKEQHMFAVNLKEKCVAAAKKHF